MAIRLSVVMVHAPLGGAQAQQLAESVVGHLIGLNGIDLTLVGPLAGLRDDSTDQLTLESLSGDVAVLDWASPAEIIDALTSLGFAGARCPHADDPDAEIPAANLRRIYALDLRDFADSNDVVAALQKLHQNRGVKTFSLDLAPSVSNDSANRADAPPPSTVPKALGEAPPAPETPEPRPTSSLPPHRHDPDELNLDSLLDQLDELDP